MGTVISQEPLDVPGTSLWLLGNTEQERNLVPSISLLDTNPHKALPCAFPVFLPSWFYFSYSPWASPACFVGRQEVGVGSAGIEAHSALRPTLGWLLHCPAVFSLKQRHLTVAIDYGKIVCG